MKILVDAIFAVFGKIPQALRIFIGRGLGRLFYRVGFRKKTILAHLGFAFPELDETEREVLVRKVYRHLGLLAVELLKMPTLSHQEVEELCSFKGVEHLRSALARGKGVLILAAHSGNWELGLAATEGLEMQTRTVVKEIKGAMGDYAMTRLRAAHGVQTIPRRNAIRRIVQTLRQGEVIGLVLDQNMTADEGIFVNFFGHAACTMPALAVLAQRCQAAVVPVDFRRDDDLIHHQVSFHPEIEWQDVSDKRDENVRHNTQRYTQALEYMICSHPDQWIWLHRRWRTQPQAEEAGTPAK